jgi:hypothetical protein
MMPGERHWIRETEETPQEDAVTSEIEQAEELAEAVREAWDAWAEFNRALHALTPPKEVVQAWDVIRPWLEQVGHKALEELTRLMDRAEEQLFLGG